MKLPIMIILTHGICLGMYSGHGFPGSASIGVLGMVQVHQIMAQQALPAIIRTVSAILAKEFQAKGFSAPHNIEALITQKKLIEAIGVDIRVSYGLSGIYDLMRKKGLKYAVEHQAPQSISIEDTSANRILLSNALVALNQPEESAFECRIS